MKNSNLAENLLFLVKNYPELEKELLSSLFSQKLFINTILTYFEQAINGNTISKSIIIDINEILPNLISGLGIPFCSLFLSTESLLDHYYNEYTQNNFPEKIKKIFLSVFHTFNFEFTENPTDDLKESLTDCNIDFKLIEVQKRKDLTKTEMLFDKIENLKSNWRLIRNLGEDEEKKEFTYLNKSLEGIIDYFNEIKINMPKANIEFFQEKMNELNKFRDKNTAKKNKKYSLSFNQENKIDSEFILQENQISKSMDNLNKNNQKNNSINITNFINNINNNNSINNNNNFNNSNFNNNQSNIIIDINKLREIPLKNRTFFYKNESLIEGENEFTEFKNYLFPLNERQVDELKRQFCGFLNNKGGRLYLGINDSKIVIGVNLNYKKRDALRNILVNTTYDFYPKCRLDKLKVYYIPIKNYNGNIFINNLYVIKIIIYPGEPNILYSMTNKGYTSSLRLQGQCANLSAEEIYKEIVRRGQIKINYSQFNLNDFNDPEPEVNFESKEGSDDDKIIFKENPESIEKSQKEKKDKKKKFHRRDVFTVEITNIDEEMHIKDLNKVFSGCGADNKKFFENNKKSRGYGWLIFQNKGKAEKFISDFNHKKIGNKNIELKLKDNNFIIV